MKNRLLLGFLCLLLIGTGCDDQTFEPVLQAGTSGAITSPGGELLFELTENNTADIFGPITWTASEYGFAAAVTYTVEMDLAGGDFSDPEILGTLNGGTSLEDVTKGELNNMLLSRGVAGNADADIDIRIKSEIADDVAPLYSDIVTLGVRTFRAAVEYPAAGEYRPGVVRVVQTDWSESVGFDVDLDPARAAGLMLSSCTDGKLLSIVSRKRMHEVMDEDFFGRVGKVAAQTFDCEKHVFDSPRQRGRPRARGMTLWGAGAFRRWNAKGHLAVSWGQNSTRDSHSNG